MGAHEGLAALKIDRARRRSRRSVWPWLVLLALVAAAALAAPRLLKFLNVPEVAVAAAIKADANGNAAAPELSAAGYVVADRQSTLAAKVTGRLIALTVSESQTVKKDELIAEVDHRELDAQIALIKAEAAEAGAEIQRLQTAVTQTEIEVAATKAPLSTIDAEMLEHKIKLADAKRRWERDKGLVEKSAMAASEQEDRLTEVKSMDARIATTAQRKIEIERKVAVAEAQVAVARAAVAVAQTRQHTVGARLKVLETQLLDSFVLAPFEGVVLEKMAEVGEIVAPISVGGSMARGSIVTIADWNSLQAEVDVAEAYIARVRPGGRAAISVDAFPGVFFPGKVRRILPRANRSKATVQVRVDFVERGRSENGDAPRILPEMGIRVKFLSDDAAAGTERGEAKEKIVIPARALHGPAGAAFVWIVLDEVARKRPVVSGEKLGENVEVKSGLAAGEVVVTSGAANLQEDNQKVRVKKL